MTPTKHLEASLNTLQASGVLNRMVHWQLCPKGSLTQFHLGASSQRRLRTQVIRQPRRGIALFLVYNPRAIDATNVTNIRAISELLGAVRPCLLVKSLPERVPAQQMSLTLLLRSVTVC